MTHNTKSDHEILSFAGLMGHDYAAVATGKDGRRHLRAECNSQGNAEASFEQQDTDRAVYRRTSAGWERRS